MSWRDDKERGGRAFFFPSPSFKDLSHETSVCMTLHSHLPLPPFPELNDAETERKTKERENSQRRWNLLPKEGPIEGGKKGRGQGVGALDARLGFAYCFYIHT